jgi:hypothetical protein
MRLKKSDHIKRQTTLTSGYIKRLSLCNLKPKLVEKINLTIVYVEKIEFALNFFSCCLGLNIINILLTAFTLADPKCAKKVSQVGSKMLVKLTLEFQRLIVLKFVFTAQRSKIFPNT